MIIEDKSYVGMATCFVCGEVKEIMLDRRLKASLPREACYDKEPCDKCKKYMHLGIIFISVRNGEPQSENPYRTGRSFVVKEEAVKRMPMPSEGNFQRGQLQAEASAGDTGSDEASNYFVSKTKGGAKSSE